MGDNRYYGSGTEKALFMLSRGTCYEPTCNVRVLKMTKSGRPQVNVQIAHIHALAEGEARYDRSIPAKQLNRFPNLILLCQAHHTEVDSEIWISDYPAEVLFDWKAAIEQGELRAALTNVPPLDDDDQLQEALVNAIEVTKMKILGAIDELKGIGEDTAEMVRTLVIEAFNRPYLTAEQIDSLEYSARIFSGMEGQTLMLHDSAVKIHNVQDYGHVLARSADTFQLMPDYIPALVRVAEAIQMLPDNAEPLCRAADVLGSSQEAIHDLHHAVMRMADMNLFELNSNVRDVERIVDRFTESVGGIDQINHTAGLMAETAEALTMVDTASVAVRLGRLEKRNIFWIGFGVAIGVVLALGILIAVLFK